MQWELKETMRSLEDQTPNEFRLHFNIKWLFVLSSILLAGASVHAQLPAGTTDATSTSQPQQDPLRAQASAALDQHDYPTAIKLLTNLTTQNTPVTSCYS